MGKQDMPKMQTYVLKVNIHCVCDGCKDKVKKLIQKTEGVYSTSMDAEQGKVVVSGVVDADKLIKKLTKSGKHAELWGGPKGNFTHGQNYPANQFHSFGNGKGGKDNKPQQQKGGRGQQKGGHFEPVQINMPSKDQKSVKFNIPEEFDASGDDFDGSEDYDDDFDDDVEDDKCEYGHGHHTANKMMPVMGNGRGSKGGLTTGVINGHGHPMNASKSHGEKGASMNFKKGGAIDLPFEIKGNGGKKGKEGKNGGSHSDSCVEKNKKGGKDKGGGCGGNNNGGSKKSVCGLLGFWGFGKKSKKVGAGTKKNKSNSVDPVASGAGNHKGKKGKHGGGDFDDFPDINAITHNIKVGNGKGGKVGHGGGGVNVGQMGPPSAQMGVNVMNNYPLGEMGNFPMDQTRDFSAVHGLPAPRAAVNGGYNPPPYQQYMPQQHQAANGNGMYHPMMYHPSMNYMPPPPMPSHPMNDPMTHIFSDENTESCRIM